MSVPTIARVPEERAPGAAPRGRATTDRRSARPRWGELELYRVLAALCVVAFHVRQSMQVKVYAPQRQGLHVGSDYPSQSVRWFEAAMTNVDTLVDFFFVISGFLLALPWARSVINGTPQPSVRAWYVGRLARCVPIYWVLVIVIWSTRNYGFPAQWQDLLEHLTFTQWMDSTRIFYTIGPAWSLADEVWLYALVPLLLVVAARPARRLRHRGARIAVVSLPVVLVGLASVAWKPYVAYVRHEPYDHWAYTFGVPAKADTFCIGMLLAIVFVAMRDRRMPAWAGVVLRCVAAGGLVWFLSHRVADDNWFRLYAHTFSALFFALLVAAVVLSRPGRLTRVVNNAFMVRAGALTFAIYICHEGLIDPLGGIGWLSQRPSMMLVNFAVFLPLAIVLAFVLHHVVEKPCMRLRLLFDDHGRVREFYPELAPGAAVPVPAQVPAPGPAPGLAPDPARGRAPVTGAVAGPVAGPVAVVPSQRRDGSLSPA